MSDLGVFAAPCACPTLRFSISRRRCLARAVCTSSFIRGIHGLPCWGSWLLTADVSKGSVDLLTKGAITGSIKLRYVQVLIAQGADDEVHCSHLCLKCGMARLTLAAREILIESQAQVVSTLRPPTSGLRNQTHVPTKHVVSCQSQRSQQWQP